MKLPTTQTLKRAPHWTLASACGSRRVNRASHAFTLIEVTIAAGILFMCLFAILALLSQTLRNARSLQRSNLDCGILAAESAVNLKLEEGQDTGDFGEMYAGYRWQSVTNLITNGLFEVEFTVFRPESDGGGESHMTILLFRPDSPLRRVP